MGNCCSKHDYVMDSWKPLREALILKIDVNEDSQNLKNLFHNLKQENTELKN